MADPLQSWAAEETRPGARRPRCTFCALNPREIERQGLKAGDDIVVSTRRGRIRLKLRRDRDVPEGMVFIPFCFNEAAANMLTIPQLDPFGKIPEFKFCAAKIERADSFEAATG